MRSRRRTAWLRRAGLLFQSTERGARAVAHRNKAKTEFPGSGLRRTPAIGPGTSAHRLVVAGKRPLQAGQPGAERIHLARQHRDIERWGHYGQSRLEFGHFEPLT